MNKGDWGPFDPALADALLERLLAWCDDDTPFVVLTLGPEIVCEVLLPALIEALEDHGGFEAVELQDYGVRGSLGRLGE